MAYQVATAKVWDGSAWVPAAQGWATVTTTPDGSYTDGSGIDWDYWIYKANGTFIISGGGLLDFLVVAGGGSGGVNNVSTTTGGGAGAGVRVPFPGEILEPGSYAITVGAGAPGGARSGNGNDGSPSSIGDFIKALGGGHGGGRFESGGSLGSGGGAGQWLSSAVGVRPRSGQGTLYQGYAGGESAVDGANGGSGAGAGAVGEDSANSGDSAKVGGVGIISTIISTTIAIAEAVGEVVSGVLYFAGGGGTPDSGAGGLGGGTRGSALNEGSPDAADNTGGGTGGADINDGTYSGDAGSGVVIIRTRG